MKRLLLCFFVPALIFSLCACNAGEGPNVGKPADDPAALGHAVTDPAQLGDTYWKAVEFSSGAPEGYQADLFLWEDGTGHFRLRPQDDEKFGHYAYMENFGCGWALEDGKLTLTSPESAARVLYEGAFEDGRLVLRYNGEGFGEMFSIFMAQVGMPPKGAQWDVTDLFGTWRMVSYEDLPNGTVTGENGRFDHDPDVSFYVYSDLSIYTTMLADYKLEITEGDLGESWSDLSVTRVEGALWEGCGNDAWYVELAATGGEETPQLAVTFADGKLLLKRKDGAKADSFYESFTAVYERLDVDLQYDWHEWDEWVGKYTFDEFAPPNQTMVYSVSITKEPDGQALSAFLQVDGFQTMTRKQAWVAGNANYIEIVFSAYDDDDDLDLAFPDNRYRTGDVILTLTRKGSDIYTTWGQLQPMLQSNAAPGIYFTKASG
jgi:predicted small secreted protein